MTKVSDQFTVNFY